MTQLTIIAPAAPGGGWDQTARAMQGALQRAGMVRIATVENVPGAAGTIGLARFISADRGKGDTVMVSGLIMLAAIVTHGSSVTLRDVTPVARLTGEYEVLVVPARSPFRSLADLLRAFKERPESISWGGGSAGGSDQILAGLIADAVGVSPRRVNYIAFSGGGEAMSAILGGQVSVGINGLAEFSAQIEAGTVRVLGISSAERLQGFDAPTLREQGVDVEFENWRSLVAPPGIAAPDLERLRALTDAMVRSPEWRELLQRYRWLDRYLAGKPFERFVQSEEVRVNAILEKLGLGGPSRTGATAGAYPAFVLLGLVACGAVAAAQSIRGRHTTPGGDHTAGDWTPVALVGAGLAAHLALVERVGFVLAAAALFWLTARAFDRRRPLRDAWLALVVSLSAYVLFVRVLKLSLPAGPLEGLL